MAGLSQSRQNTKQSTKQNAIKGKTLNKTLNKMLYFKTRHYLRQNTNIN